MAADDGQARFGKAERLGQQPDDLVIRRTIGRRSRDAHFKVLPSAGVGLPVSDARLGRSRGYPNSNDVPPIVQIHGAFPTSHARRVLVGVIEILSQEESM